MAKRFTDTEKWKKPFIRSLKWLSLYLSGIINTSANVLPISFIDDGFSALYLANILFINSKLEN
jgi:hypothetical protein